MWPFLQNPAEQYFGKTPTALLQEGLGWGKLPAKPTATDLPTANQESTGGAAPALAGTVPFPHANCSKGEEKIHQRRFVMPVVMSHRRKV